MDKFVALLVSGGVSGAVYSLLAVGLVLTYSASRIFNFAHTGVAFAIAFLFYELTSGFHWPRLLAGAFCVVIVAPLLGLLTDNLVLRRMVGVDDSTRIVATVGLLIAVPAIVLLMVETLYEKTGLGIQNSENIIFPPGLGPTPKHLWRPWGTVTLDSNQLIVFAAAATAAAGLWYLLSRTRFGLRVRATVDRPILAEYRGVDTVRTSRWMCMLGFGLAGLAGVAGAPFFSLTPSAYTGLLAVAAAAAVFGGFRSIPLAFAGGLLVGVIQSMFSGYVAPGGQAGLTSAVPYVLLLVGLFVLARDRRRVAGQIAEVRLPVDNLAGLSRMRRLTPWIVAVAAFIAFVQFGADDYWLSLTAKGLAYALILLSFVIVTGIGGMVSLAQASFALAASLTTGLLMSHGWGFLPSAVVGIAAAVVVGTVVALPALRLGGVALALATLALALLAGAVLFDWRPLTNGDFGWSIARPVYGPLDLNDDRLLSLTLLGLVGLCTLMIYNVRRGPSGRAILAARSAAAAASSVGVSVVHAKLRVFAFSAAVAGAGGVMLSVVTRSANSLSIPAETGLLWLAIVVLFGIRRPAGALIAGLMLTMSAPLISHLTTSSRIQDILFGLGAVQLAKTPDGIISHIGGNLAALRRRRLRTGTARATSAGVEPSVGSVPSPAHTPASASPLRPTPSLRDESPLPSAGHVSQPGEVDRPHSDALRPLGAAGLRLRGVSAGYDAADVLHSVDLFAPRGEITALLGVNGAGKSTLCAVAAGGLAVTAGTVELDGVDITTLKPHERTALGLAFAPESRGIFPTLTVADNLALTLPSPDDRRTVYARFPALAARRDLEAGSLSGGEQQMLTLAPLLIRPPAVLIADEPSLGLAPALVGQIMELLGELRAAGTAVLVVEEKAQHVMGLADRVSLLNLGTLEWDLPAADVDVSRLASSYLRT